MSICCIAHVYLVHCHVEWVVTQKIEVDLSLDVDKTEKWGYLLCVVGCRVSQGEESGPGLGRQTHKDRGEGAPAATDAAQRPGHLLLSHWCVLHSPPLSSSLRAVLLFALSFPNIKKGFLQLES